MIIGLIGGHGKWGQNYLKLADQLNIQFKVAGRNDWTSLISSKTCDGIIIATPPESHVDIAIECLKNNIPVMIEKPLSLSLDDALKLKQYENNAPILVNHLHLFSPAFEKMCSMINPNEIINIESVGCNKGPYRSYSSLLDYGCHDIAMGLFLFKSINLPKIDYFYSLSSDGIGNIFNFCLKYSPSYHKIRTGNDSIIKERIFEVTTTDNNTFVYNDLIDNKLSCNGVTIFINNISPLQNALQCFLDAINGKQDDRLGLDLSFKVMEVIQNINNLIVS